MTAQRTRLSLLPTTLLAIALSILGAEHGARAVTTEPLVVETSADFLRGELDGTAVTSTGEVRTSVGEERFPIADASVAYALARGRDGSIYVGTGTDGKIFRLRGRELAPFATTGQLVVSSLAVGADGTLYAGTLPEGRIFAIAADGTSRELARPEGAEHVWALVHDARRDRLFAATGPHGKVFAIDRTGRAAVFYAGEDAHVMSLALDADGTLYAGTSDRALVLRLRAPGQAEVLVDLPGNEVTALSVRDGELAVVGNDFGAAPAQSAPQGPRSLPPQARSRPRPGKGRLYRIDREGRVERVLSEDDHHFTACELARDGTIFVGGKDGRVVRVAPDRTSATWLDVEERLVLALSLDSDTPVVATGDGAAIYRILRTPAERPTWTSAVLDAEARSRFGRLVTRSSGPLSVSTRSGNTETPDATWSEWSAYTSAGAAIGSPAARDLQIRVRFDDADAVLRGVTAYHLRQNQRPVVGPVTTTVDATQASARRRGRAAASSTVRLSWRVDNPDGDDLRYRLRFRRDGEETWRALTRPDQNVTQTTYDWDTTGVPDGFYVVEVEASDEPSNPESRTLSSRAVSAPFLVDNHAPRIEELALRGDAVVGRIVDAVGPISRLEVAIDGAPFRDVDPADGLLDQAEERLELVVPHDASHLVAVRATDQGGHQVVAEIDTSSRRLEPRRTSTHNP